MEEEEEARECCCYICCDDTRREEVVHVCDCFDRLVHRSCQRRMARARQSIHCPVCLAPFRNATTTPAVWRITSHGLLAAVAIVCALVVCTMGAFVCLLVAPWPLLVVPVGTLSIAIPLATLAVVVHVVRTHPCCERSVHIIVT